MRSHYHNEVLEESKNFSTRRLRQILTRDQTRKCIDNTKKKHIHSSSVRGLNHHCSKYG